MKLPDGQPYYADRDVEHTAQGDIYRDLSFVMASVVETTKPSGARKRGQSTESVLPSSITTGPRPGIVLHYTCGITAQPTGTQGYSHHYRLVAPIVGLAELRAMGSSKNEVRSLEAGKTLYGLLYLPAEGIPLRDTSPPAGHEGDAAALLYAATTVHQDALDASERVARLTEAAQRLLIAQTMSLFSPSLYDPALLQAPDMSDGWATPITP